MYPVGKCRLELSSLFASSFFALSATGKAANFSLSLAAFSAAVSAMASMSPLSLTGLELLDMIACWMLCAAFSA